MRKFLRPLLAVITGVVIYFGSTYLLLMIDQQVAFLGAISLAFLAGLAFKAKGNSGLLTYTSCISVVPVIGFGILWYMTGSNAGLLFIPFILASAALGNYLRNNAGSIFRRKIALAVGSYALICTLVVLAVVPNMSLLSFTDTVSEPVPSVELMTLEKETKPVSEIGKKIVVMDFWATWCGPCLQLMPELERLKEKYADNPNVTIKAVNTSWKNSLSDVRKFLQENPKDVDVLYDKNAQLTQKLGIRGIPHTVIIDNEEGKVRMRKKSFTPSQNYVKTMSKHIDQLLDNSET